MDEPPQVHEGEEIEIYTLMDDDGVIQNHGFIDCTIMGPAVLATSQSYWARNRATGPVDRVFYDLSPEQIAVIGAILVRRCSFERCLFHRVGIVTHADQREAMKREFVQVDLEEE